MEISWHGSSTGNSHTKHEVDFHGGTKPGRNPLIHERIMAKVVKMWFTATTPT